MKACYNAGVEGYVVSNPGKRVTCYDMGAIFGNAFNRVAAPEKAVQGFRAAGLWPFNPEVFSDADFIAASLTDEPEPADEPRQPIDESAVATLPEPEPEKERRSAAGSGHCRYRSVPATGYAVGRQWTRNSARTKWTTDHPVSVATSQSSEASANEEVREKCR